MAGLSAYYAATPTPLSPPLCITPSSSSSSSSSASLGRATATESAAPRPGVKAFDFCKLEGDKLELVTKFARILCGDGGKKMSADAGATNINRTANRIDQANPGVLKKLARVVEGALQNLGDSRLKGLYHCCVIVVLVGQGSEVFPISGITVALRPQHRSKGTLSRCCTERCQANIS